MLWRAALVASTLCFVTQCLFTSGKECMQDVVLQTAEDVKTFSARNCSVIRGSLFLWGLEPSRSSVGGCYSSRVLQALDLPTIDSVTLITGGLEVYNLFENYRNLSQLLPNLKRVEGRKAVLDGTKYSLAVTDNLFLEDIGRLKLERGCVLATNNVKVFLNVTEIVSRDPPVNESLCNVCYHDVSEELSVFPSDAFPPSLYCPEAQCDTSAWQELDSELMKTLEGCTYIKGGLVFSGFLDVSVSDLTKYFGQVKEVRDYVVVFSTYELASLSFLSNLTTIKGEKLWKNKYALALVSNSNLARLWPGVENLSIKNGQAFVHKNTVLCQKDYSNLLQALETVPQGSYNSLGGFCLESGLKLSVDVYNITDQDVSVKWSNGTWFSRVQDQYTVVSYEVLYEELAESDEEKCGVDGSVTDQSFANWYVHLLPGDDRAVDLVELEPDTWYWIFIRSDVLFLNKTLFPIQTQEYADAICFKTLEVEPITVWQPTLTTNEFFQRCKGIVVSLSQRETDAVDAAEFHGYIVSVHSVVLQSLNSHKVDEDDSSSTQYLETSSRRRCYSIRYSVNESSKDCFDYTCDVSFHSDHTEETTATAVCPCLNETGILQLPLNTGLNSSSSSLLLSDGLINLTLSRNNGPLRDYRLSMGSVHGGRTYIVQVKAWLGNDTCSVWSNPLVLFTGPIWSNDVVTDLKVNGSIQSKPGSSPTLLIDISWKSPQTPNGVLVGYAIVISTLEFFSGLQSGSAKFRKIMPEIPVICRRPTLSLSFHDLLSNSFAICTINWTSIESPGPHELSYSLQHFITPPDNFSITVTVFTKSAQYYDDDLIDLPFTNSTITVPGNQSLRLDQNDNNQDVPQAAIIAPAVVSILCLIVMIAVVGYCIVGKRRRFLMQNQSPDNMEAFNMVYSERLVYVSDEWEVDREDVIVEELLGEGAFGKVHRGIFQRSDSSQTVAIKSCRNGGDSEDATLFLNEASVMKEFDCEYIVRLLGIVSNGEPALVIMEIMELGNLKTYLRSLRLEGSSGEPVCLSRNKMTKMATQIASGMAYLSEKKFVHRDLAARNCMVDSDTTVKIGDFGMTRDIHLNDYYRKRGRGPMPVRWMGPESLRDGIFSHASDVWSYGVVLWEIATLGSLPYPGLSNEEVFQSVGKGNLMKLDELPTFPDLLRKLMKECWMTDPSCRPSFVKILCHLPALEGCEAEV
eukprot:m.182202 g.182202  ORF g.182202 m.182202 type:complete len:1194 (+) comp39289_c0_seq20:59-3640(+)